MADNSQRIATSIYLLTHEHKPTAGDGTIELAIPGLDSTHLVIPPYDSQTPKWADALLTLFPRRTPEEAPPFDIKSQHPGAILFISLKDTHLAIAFGTGWTALKKADLVHDFGIRAALAGIESSELRSLTRRQIFLNALTAHEQAANSTRLTTFGFDNLRDIANSVKGNRKASVQFLGKTLQGATALHTEIRINQLAKALEEALQLYRAKTANATWPELFNVQHLRDLGTVTSLETKLEELVSKQSDQVKLAAPELGNHERSFGTYQLGRFRSGRGGSAAGGHSILDISRWYHFLGQQKKKPSLEEARNTPIHFLNESGERIQTTTVFDCLVAEVSMPGAPSTAVLSDGRWFQASVGFQKQLQRALDSVQTTTHGFSAPWWKPESMDEGHFNANAAKNNPRLTLLDAKSIFIGGGHSQIEFADLGDPKRRVLYFAKIPTKSSSMSHLAEQIRRTVELYFGVDPEFRIKVKAKFGAFPKERPTPTQWELCMVLIGGRLRNLPFFARCTCAQLTRELSQKHLKLTVMEVP